MDTYIDETVIQDEAKSTFDMRARLAGISRRSKTVTVYTDDVAGATLGGVEDELVGEYRTGRKIRTGLIGELDEIHDRFKRETDKLDKDADDYDELVAEMSAAVQAEVEPVKKQVKALQVEMHKTSMTFTLQTLPEIIVRSMTRRTKAVLDIKGKGIPEGLEEDYSLEYAAQFVSASVSKWVDNQTGESFAGLPVEMARELRDYLPVGQFARLTRAVSELSQEAQISNQATDTPDFS